MIGLTSVSTMISEPHTKGGIYHDRPPQKTNAHLKEQQFLCKKNHCCIFQTVEKVDVAAIEDRSPRSYTLRFNSVLTAITRFLLICTD
jgi:hypothetical protein